MSVGMFRKAIAAAIAALTILGTALVDGAVSQSEGIAVVVAFLSAFGVYRVRNEQPEVEDV